MSELLSNMELYLQGSPIIALLVAFLGGLVASFTPCTYPMIPITVAVIGGKSIGEKGKLRGFLLSLIYVSGMALSYALMGMFAALTGRFFGEINSNPWVMFGLANFVMIFALVMLDVIQMPTLSLNLKQSQRKGNLGVFLIGMASGLVAGPCTAPILAIVLAYVATTKSVILGGSLLFVFAFGMGFILILAGTFSGFLSSLPKSGNWMIRVKKGVGFLLILVAEYFLIKMGQTLL